MPDLSPHDVIAHLAKAAHAIGMQANVGASEMAGAMVSFLAANPERIEIFLADGWLAACRGCDPWADGCLTFLSMEGKITTPRDLRIAKTVRDLAKPVGDGDA